MTEKNIKKVKQGKKNRTSGRDFELRVRKDLESKGWIVDKWSNNVEFNLKEIEVEKTYLNPPGRDVVMKGKLIPAKAKWNNFTKSMMMGKGGFPDFVCIKVHDLSNPQTYHVQFVECKTNGYLDKIEKEKCEWLQNQGYNILIASKHKIKNRIHIEYKEFNGN